MRRPTVFPAMVVLTLSLGSCTWLASTKTDAAPPVDVPGAAAGAMDRAAAAANGQRVLVVVARPGVAPAGRIVQSARAPEGWRPYAPTYDPADPLVPVLDALADAAAKDFATDRRFERDTVRALQVFGVAVVVASDGTSVITPAAEERDPNVGISPEVPALRLRHTNPVFLLLADGGQRDPADPVGYVKSLRYGDAQFQDDSYSQWGGAVTIDASAEGEYLFPWSAAGARVTLDGSSVEPRAAGLPMLLVKVPQGRHRVEVAYGDAQTLREIIVIASAAGVVIGLLAMWLALRPHPDPLARP